LHERLKLRILGLYLPVCYEYVSPRHDTARDIRGGDKRDMENRGEIKVYWTRS
jgi:hypothetical protein